MNQLARETALLEALRMLNSSRNNNNNYNNNNNNNNNNIKNNNVFIHLKKIHIKSNNNLKSTLLIYIFKTFSVYFRKLPTTIS